MQRGGGGGGGGWYSYFFLIRRLLFTPKKYQQFRHTQRIFEILATPKTYSHSRKSFTMYRNDLKPPPPPPGGTLLLSYIRRLGCFWGFKILNFNILGFFPKNKYFLGYEDFVDIFLGSSQNWTIFRGYFYASYGLFLRSLYRMGIFFGVA